MKWPELIELCPVPSARTYTRGFEYLADVEPLINQIREVFTLPSVWPQRQYVVAGNTRQVEELRREYNMTPMELVPVHDFHQFHGLTRDSWIILAPGFERSTVFDCGRQLRKGLEFLMSRSSWKTGRLCRLVDEREVLTAEKIRDLKVMYECMIPSTIYDTPQKK